MGLSLIVPLNVPLIAPFYILPVKLPTVGPVTL